MATLMDARLASVSTRSSLSEDLGFTKRQAECVVRKYYLSFAVVMFVIAAAVVVICGSYPLRERESKLTHVSVEWGDNSGSDRFARVLTLVKRLNSKLFYRSVCDLFAPTFDLTSENLSDIQPIQTWLPYSDSMYLLGEEFVPRSRSDGIRIVKCKTGVAKCKKTGVAKCKTGVVKCKTGVAKCKTGVVKCKTGVAKCKTGVAKCKTGVANCKAGVAKCKTGVAKCKTGVVKCKTDVAKCKTGVGQCKLM
ncbi:hypothetical protein Btru_000739 [Bulinus truncatus]|nr:hypothetical protein Btru_000739 [Bulinus truncatus]